ncbi:recombinase family protein [Rossellomorea arthrocnemi]|uniref:recombinase family protein n=1 Tax=Rossellomorea arthrocnemi TaxID=2769542 RepID=UPI001917F342|nr:recombinase family protein [Rossellomorea arthrocnemi]
MEKCKATAVYARTSSKKQNFVLQIEAASPHLKGIEPEGLFYFVDEGVSGFSKPVDLLKLIDLIKNDKIGTLVVYNRKRLVTSLDIYLQLVNLIDKHKVKVIFTATDEDTLGDMFSEGFKALMIKYEGIMLSNRIKAGKKYSASRN